MKRTRCIFLMLLVMMVSGVWAQENYILNIYDHMVDDTGEAIPD